MSYYHGYDHTNEKTTDYASRLLWCSVVLIAVTLFFVVPCNIDSFSAGAAMLVSTALSLLTVSVLVGLLLSLQRGQPRNRFGSNQTTFLQRSQLAMALIHKFVFWTGVILLAALLVVLLSSYGEKKNNRNIEITIVQVNDVYEIAAPDGGSIGGMARVATLKKQCLQRNPNTLLVMAGDFVSPSVFNSVSYNEENVPGKQMIETMNAAGFDIAVFGNHEFDIKEPDLQKRMNESRFIWVASNTFHTTTTGRNAFEQNGKPLPAILFKTFIDNKGNTAKIGFIGLTIDDNKKPFVQYDTPANATAVKLYNKYKDSCDAIIAITHQNMKDDSALAKQLPWLAAIIGGHEHNGPHATVGHVPITKAYANARSAYVLKMVINTKNKQVTVTPVKVDLDSTVRPDRKVQEITDKWMNISYNYFKNMGFSPDEIVQQTGKSLEGRDEFVRKGPTNLTDLIATAMQSAYPKSQVAVFNAGAIRVDDVLNMPVSQYDILRAMPYMDSVKLVKMKGSTLTKLYLVSRSLPPDNGMFLQFSPSFAFDAVTKKCTLGGVPIDEAGNYYVAMADYILHGKQSVYDFLKSEPVTILTKPDTKGNVGNIDYMVIDYLKKQEFREQAKVVLRNLH